MSSSTSSDAPRLAPLPPHLAEMAEFTLATGLRARYVRELVWSQADLSRRTAWLYADQVKNNTDLTVPLNSTAIAVIRRRIGSHDTHVFSYRGKPLRNINADAWQRACDKAGITDFRWHDLRHTWASWHVQKRHQPAGTHGTGRVEVVLDGAALCPSGWRPPEKRGREYYKFSTLRVAAGNAGTGGESLNI